MTTLTILCILIAFSGVLIISFYSDNMKISETKKGLLTTLGILLLCTGVYALSGIFMHQNPLDHHSTKFSVKYKIEQKYVNDTLVETDTIYTIAPKTK